ncbi:MAG: alanine--tRNA ligase [Candidatus Moranbacteria bacterium]|nr:alanine--tRNA ligase [Candidatus Moranbacteria bacterium]
MTAEELRENFLDFFKAKGHTIIPSASLVPREIDPSVLFTTAGMHPFKQYYLNPDETSDARIATSQKCVRTIDIDEVGDDTHLTFFEMLGNFSFGYPKKENSYFKEETIKFAWEFLTEILGIEKSRIYATYFHGEKEIPEDKESLEILKSISDLKEIKPQGTEDNFWSLGVENSPGGPTVEFYVDGIEVWNCVFNEYTFKKGQYELSENKGVDTGMGLERLLAVVDKKKTVFETDLFVSIISKIEEISGKKYEDNQKSFRIISDHIKAATFIIADGIIPSNVKQGYVLRRLIRRAIRHGKILGIENNFTKDIAEIVISTYSNMYLELKENGNKIFEELEKEENKFRKTLAGGLKEFEKLTAITGKDAFNLYQTYGFPLEMTEELAVEKNIKIDKDEFETEFKKHQELSRTASAGQFKGGLADTSEQTKKLHTAAHLMLAAIRKILSGDIIQKGSNITEERLRFDFNYPEKLTKEQIAEIENIVNQKIVENIPVEMTEMPKDEALKLAKVSFDPAKYGDIVKVYKIGDFSIELCGGPHVENTGQLGKFMIKKEESSSAGVRRIKAVLE